ncbi:MAG: peptidyl-prolyl cis-trans isomerase, partial [Pseudomonadota bacterium]|nr:peptidyl-prolyl cis-trans isomerase [Pseudomonadota bacterium]
AFDNRQFESAENKRAILDQLIDERLAEIAARNAGIVIPDALVRREIERIPDFQLEGKFSPQRYQALLASQNPPMSPLQFDQYVRNDLLRRSLAVKLAESGFVTANESDRLIKSLLETRDIYATVITPALDESLAVSDAEIDGWYKSHGSDYRAPETVNLEYVEVLADALPPSVPNEGELRTRYDAEKSKFGTAEQRLVSHILIPVDASADAAAQKAAQDTATKLADEARAGADFAALAKANSGDPGSAGQGGDLGWMQRDGSMVKPFEDAVFGMEDGAVSAPIKTDFGWHIIQLRGVRAGTLQPFEAVRDQLLAEAEASGRERAYNDLLGQLVDGLMKNPSGFAEVAAAHGLQVKTIGPVPKGGGDGIAAHPAVQREAFSELRIGDSGVSDPINISADHSVLLRVTGHTAEAAKPLAEVRDQVVGDIRRDRAGKQAEQTAAELVAAVKKGESLESLGKARDLRVDHVPQLPRNAQMPSAEAIKAIFQAPRPAEGQHSAGQFKLPDGSWLAYEVIAVNSGKLDEIPQDQRAEMRRQLALANGDQAGKAYIDAMRKRMKITIVENQL